MSKEVEFNFRVWVPPKGSERAKVEIWYQGIEPMDPMKCFYADWVEEVFSWEDYHERFDLDPQKRWQVVGKGVLRSVYTYADDWDEHIDILSFEKAEVPENWYQTRHPDPDMELDLDV